MVLPSVARCTAEESTSVLYLHATKGFVVLLLSEIKVKRLDMCA
jgi:hypothetical protein